MAPWPLAADTLIRSTSSVRACGAGFRDGDDSSHSACILFAELVAEYEDYLDSFVQPVDLFYMEDEELARQLVELDIKGPGDLLSRGEFERLKTDETQRAAKFRNTPKSLTHAGLEAEYRDFPLLVQLAQREELVLLGKLATIIFIRTRNRKGQEISGFIDYAHRLKVDTFEDYFARRKLFQPRPSDLSYYNWETQTCSSNATTNFQVIADSDKGLQFKNKRDRKLINVSPDAQPGHSSFRKVIEDAQYIQCVLYDHVTRRKA